MNKKEELIKVIIANADGTPSVSVIENKLEVFQEIVGGLIEVVDLGGGVLAIINEEGKLINLPPNFGFAQHYGDQFYFDIIMGNVIFVADIRTEEGLEFRSLTEEERDYAMHTYIVGKGMLELITENPDIEH